ncbi:MAG: hypothetical protein SF172_04235 [Burkholderiales bacterium]|nr:hypothetical protein [Burkholderiales bacterium]
MSEGAAWAGVHLRPLPYESMWSVIRRFKQRNALSEWFIRSRLAVDKDKSLGERFEGLSGITVDYAEEAAVHAILDPFLSHRCIRNCPTCISAGYHSYWHQLRILQQCPIHLVPLVGHCASCGKPSPQYVPHEAGQLSMLCEHCGDRWIADEPTVQAMEELSKDSSKLRQAFVPFSGWTQRCVSGRDLATALAATCQQYRDWEWWGWSESWLANLQCLGLSMPSGGERTSSPNAVLIRWRTDRPGCTSKPLCANEVGRVYDATIRSLWRWVSDGKALPDWTYTNDLFEDELDLVQWQPTVLAWFLLRMFVEGWAYHVNGMVASNLPQNRMHAFEWLDPLPWRSRLTLRAYLLSAYASSYHRISQFKSQRHVKLKDLQIPSCSAVIRPFGWLKRRYVAFPEVTGMPLFPFKPLQSVDEVEPERHLHLSERIACGSLCGITSESRTHFCAGRQVNYRVCKRIFGRPYKR